ncbi:MAG TPA: hypothetical protein VK669_02780 [Candidatus Limnocylindrales bacterium]|nr:hypothetical protein [Candidatus Limnocylindrales bacterium]
MADHYGVYEAGGATAAEFLDACFATFSVGDWAAILAAVGLTVWQVASQIHCYAAAFGS